MQRLSHLGGDGLTLVDLGNGLHHIQLGVATCLLTEMRGRLHLLLCCEPGVALATKVTDGNADLELHLVLHQRTAIGIGKAVGHLVKTYRGVDAGIKALLLFELCGLAFRLKDAELRREVMGIILLSLCDGIVSRDMNSRQHLWHQQLQLCCGVETYPCGQFLRGPLVFQLCQCQRITGISQLQFED